MQDKTGEIMPERTGEIKRNGCHSPELAIQSHALNPGLGLRVS